LKEFKDDMDEEKRLVRLSDILEKKGIFPEGTVVVPYVCRSTLVDHMCARSPSPSDYMTYMSDAVMSAKSDVSINTPKTSLSVGNHNESTIQKMSENYNSNSLTESESDDSIPNTPQNPHSAQSAHSVDSWNSWHSWGSKYGGFKKNKKRKTLKKRRS
jgi:hypothetical protein